MTEFNLFCYAEKYNDSDSFQQKRYRAWNKEVGEDRYKEIKEKVLNIMEEVKPELNENSWKEEWGKVPNSVWLEISKIPEFDKEITEKIINNKISLEQEMIEINGNKWSKETVLEALKKHTN